MNDDPDEAQQIVGGAIQELTDTELPEGTLATAWENLTFTVDPIACSLATSATTPWRSASSIRWIWTGSTT